MNDNLQRCLAIICGIVVAYLLLSVLRSFAITAEARGLCAGVAGYMVGDFIAAPRRRRKR